MSMAPLLSTLTAIPQRYTNQGTFMNPKQILIATIAVASLTSAGLVSAQEATQAAWPESTRTRAEVQADLVQARRDGSIKAASVTYGQPARSTLSREAVRDELAQAQRDGSIKVRSLAYGQPASSTLSREEVRADVAAAHGSPRFLTR